MYNLHHDFDQLQAPALLLDGGPGGQHRARQRAVAGLIYLHGHPHPFPLHLAPFRAYASSIPLPKYLQSSIPGPWPMVSWARFAPARLPSITKPQPQIALASGRRTFRLQVRFDERRCHQLCRMSKLLKFVEWAAKPVSFCFWPRAYYDQEQEKGCEHPTSQSC